MLGAWDRPKTPSGSAIALSGALLSAGNFQLGIGAELPMTGG
jgi:hypothetical protein